MRRVVILLAFAGPAFAQPVQYLESKKTFLLTSRQSSYALGIAADGALRHLYWGAPLWRAEDLPAAAQRRDLSSFDPRQMMEAEEFPGWGGPRYYEPALKLSRDDGNRDVVLKYASHRINGNELAVALRDINDPIEVTLHYVIYPEHGILRRHAVIRNGTQRALTLESAQSAVWNLPAGEGYNLTYSTGRWAGEDQLHHEPIHEAA